MEPMSQSGTNVLATATVTSSTATIRHLSRSHTEVTSRVSQDSSTHACVNIGQTVPTKMRKTVEEAVRLVCKVCGTCFTKPFLLDRHMKSHSGVRPFKCPHCEKCFTENSILKKHLTVHSDTKPHRCDQCAAAFRQAYNLVIHKRRHTGEKPHTCGTCGRSFAQPGSYHEHLRTHTKQQPYKCDIDKCTASFSRRYSLTIHKRVHASERPFQCGECDAAFLDNSSLSRHVRIHTGEKPYICSICSKSFNQSGSLKVHSRIHSSGNCTTARSTEELHSKQSGHRPPGTDGKSASAGKCEGERPCHQRSETTIAVVAQTIVQSLDCVPSGTSEIELRII